MASQLKDLCRRLKVPYESGSAWRDEAVVCEYVLWLLGTLRTSLDLASGKPLVEEPARLETTEELYAEWLRTHCSPGWLAWRIRADKNSMFPRDNPVAAAAYHVAYMAAAVQQTDARCPIWGLPGAVYEFQETAQAQGCAYPEELDQQPQQLERLLAAYRPLPAVELAF
jgi:hypothetical protein